MQVYFTTHPAEFSPALNEHLAERYFYLMPAILVALDATTGQKFRNHKDWSAWWEKNKKGFVSVEGAAPPFFDITPKTFRIPTPETTPPSYEVKPWLIEEALHKRLPGVPCISPWPTPSTPVTIIPALVNALIFVDDPRVAPLVARYDLETAERPAIVESLGSFGASPTAAAKLAEILQSNPPRPILLAGFRAVPNLKLALVRREGLVTVVGAFVSEDDVEIATDAVHCLAAIRTRDVMSWLLMELVRDEGDAARAALVREIHVALQSITGLNFPNHDGWRRWWDANAETFEPAEAKTAEEPRHGRGGVSCYCPAPFEFYPWILAATVIAAAGAFLLATRLKKRA